MSTSTITKKRSPFVVCIGYGEYAGELLIGKVYRTLKPEKNDPAHELRLIDESGEDYLYPAKWFVPIDLPAKARRVLSGANVAA